MHPNEIKNRALVAASCADVEGFYATAKALRQIAYACSEAAGVLAVPDQDLEQSDRGDTAFKAVAHLHPAH